MKVIKVYDPTKTHPTTNYEHFMPIRKKNQKVTVNFSKKIWSSLKIYDYMKMGLNFSTFKWKEVMCDLGLELGTYT